MKSYPILLCVFYIISLQPKIMSMEAIAVNEELGDEQSGTARVSEDIAHMDVRGDQTTPVDTFSIKHERILIDLNETSRGSSALPVRYKLARVLIGPKSDSEPLTESPSRVVVDSLPMKANSDEVSAAFKAPYVKTGIISAAVGVPVGAALFFVGRKAFDWVKSKSASSEDSDDQMGDDSIVVEEFSEWVERCKSLGKKIYGGTENETDALQAFTSIARKNPYDLLNDSSFIAKLDENDKAEFLLILDSFAANYFCTMLVSILSDAQSHVLQLLLDAPGELPEEVVDQITDTQKMDIQKLFAKIASFQSLKNSAKF